MCILQMFTIQYQSRKGLCWFAYYRDSTHILLQSCVFLHILESNYSQDFANFPEVNKMAFIVQVCEHGREAVQKSMAEKTQDLHFITQILRFQAHAIAYWHADLQIRCIGLHNWQCEKLVKTSHFAPNFLCFHGRICAKVFTNLRKIQGYTLAQLYMPSSPHALPVLIFVTVSFNTSTVNLSKQ